MIKRFNPDFSLSISHELAYMRETPEGGYVAHGDYATLFSELELVKAERDALEQRVNELAVENRRLCERLTHAEGCFSAATFEGLDEALVESAGSMLADIVSRRIVYAFPAIKEPYGATDAALAAIEARGVEKLADKLDAEIEQIMRGAFFYDEISSREAISKMVREFAKQLREAK